MGTVIEKIPYYVTRKAWPGSRERWGYWAPSKKMKALGFHMVRCGPDGPEAHAIARTWNQRWEQARKESKTATATTIKNKKHRPGSLGEAFAAYRAMSAWATKKPRTQEDWWRGWAYLEPFFGDRLPSEVTAQRFDRFHTWLKKTKGVGETARAVKIWRALWHQASKLTSPLGGYYCEESRDPSKVVHNEQPKPRNQIWYEGEAARLCKAAWRDGYRGLAAALVVAWDTMLSPVDVRTLTLAQLRQDGQGAFFRLARAKTGKEAIGTLSRRGKRVLDRYIATLPFTLLPGTPIFHTRGGAPGPMGGRPRPPVPYTADTLGDDFRAIRNKLFAEDDRTLMDFRRSGAVEATAGESILQRSPARWRTRSTPTKRCSRPTLPVERHAW
jgi:hypothetical protein